MSPPSPRPPLRAVLFDAVGTLFELREPVGETYARFAGEQGAEIPASRIDEAFGRVLAAAPPNAHPELEAAARPEAERAWWRQRVRETLRAADQMVRVPDFEAYFGALFGHYATADAWALRAGVAPALEALAARSVKLAVVSNFDARIGTLLAGLGIAVHFRAIVGPTETGVVKPDVRAFARALEALGVSADAAAYVGDPPEAEFRAARSLGLRVLDASRLATLERVPTLLVADAEEETA